ncbi:unnamed protein product [Pseudo-nitzschia multistriata]|uniref:Uncharacterized protein n=1 Tax=Pseudo-nitzschia multistriata TaxID=183589 RepID=A0A448Z9E0_9STRA|nr:unnamed protein product [Pseudo-nitzschia multistriata]
MDQQCQFQINVWIVDRLLEVFENFFYSQLRPLVPQMRIPDFRHDMNLNLFLPVEFLAKALALVFQGFDSRGDAFGNFPLVSRRVGRVEQPYPMVVFQGFVDARFYQISLEVPNPESRQRHDDTV